MQGKYFFLKRICNGIATQTTVVSPEALDPYKNITKVTLLLKRCSPLLHVQVTDVLPCTGWWWP